MSLCLGASELWEAQSCLGKFPTWNRSALSAQNPGRGPPNSLWSGGYIQEPQTGMARGWDRQSLARRGLRAGGGMAGGSSGHLQAGRASQWDTGEWTGHR